jgi:hypothetical protein
VTTQLSGNTRLKFGLNLNPQNESGRLPPQDGTANPDFNWYWGDVRTSVPNYTYQANLDYVASSKLYLAARGGYFKYDRVEEGIPDLVWHQFVGSNMGYADIPEGLRRLSGFNSVPTNFASKWDVQTRTSLSADATYYANFAGQHTLKTGLQFNRIGNDVMRGEQQPRIYLNWGRILTTLDGRRVTGEYGYYRVRQFQTTGDIHSDSIGLFIQDSWTVNDRLTLNLGLRTESETVPSYIPGHLGIDFGFADKIAPRAGFALDVKGDGKWKSYGSWGVFYDIAKLEMPRGLFGGDKWLDYRYSLDTYDWPSIDCTGPQGSGCPGTFYEVVDYRHASNDPKDPTIDPNLKPMQSQELTLGLDHELNPTMSLGVRFVRKWLNRAIEDVGLIDPVKGAEVYFIANPGFGMAEYTIGREFPAQPKAVRDYDGLEFRMRRRMSSNWAANVSYLLSRLQGNYSGLSSSDEDGRASPNVNRFFDSIHMSFDERAQPVFGRLGTDRPHQLKAQLIYDLPIGTTLSISQLVQSGTPISRMAYMVSSTPVFYKGRLSDGRMPTYSQTDLYVQHQLDLPGSTRAVFSLNVMNAFDQKTTIRVFQYETRDNIAISNPAFFAGFDTQQLIAQQNIRRDPRFLQPSLFQFPRSIRLSAKFLF